MKKQFSFPPINIFVQFSLEKFFNKILFKKLKEKIEL